MILGLFWFLVANGAVLLGTHALLGRVRTGRSSTDLVFFLLIRLTIISAAVIFGGLTRTLTPTGLGLMGTVILSILLACGVHKSLRVPSFPEVGVLTGVFAAIVLARLLAQVWFFSPYVGDALGYHLPKVAEWVRAGAFTREMGTDTHVTFPAGFELVETWWVVFFRHDVLIEMAGVEFLFLAFASVYALSETLGLGNRASFAAGILYVMTPGLHLQATSCLNDAPAAALIVATATLVMAHASPGPILLAVGLGAGIKATYLYALPGILILWILSRRDRPVESGSRRWIAGLAALGILVGGFWYARNLAWYGSPTYPVGRHGLSGPFPIQFGPRFSSLKDNVGNLVFERLYDAASPYGALTNDISGWGGAAFACGLLALLWALREDRRYRLLAGAFAISLAGISVSVLADPWSMRFLLFFPAILSIATARLAQASRAMAVVAGAAVALEFFGTILPLGLPAPAFGVLAGEGWRARSLAQILDCRSSGDSIGYFADSRNVPYLLYKPDFSCRVVYLRSKSADDLIAEIKRSGVDHVYAAPAGMDHSTILLECERRGYLRRERGALYSVH